MVHSVRFDLCLGLAASLLPQPAILTPSYSGNASYGAQYATTNSLYHYNGFPVAQPLLTSSYDSCNLLASQQLATSKNSNLTGVNQYKVPIQSLSLNASNCSGSSTAAHSSKSTTLQRAKKPTGTYSFTSDPQSRHVNDIQKNSSYDNSSSSSLGARMDGSRMMSPTHALPISCSMSQSDFMTSSDLTFSHMLDAVTSPQSTVSHSATSQTSTRHASRHPDVGRLLLQGSEFGLESLTGNSGLDLSQFSKHDTSSKPSYLTEMNFPTHEFSMSHADSPLTFSHHCEIMSANKEPSTLNSAQTGHSQQSKLHLSGGGRSSPLPWSTTTQFCDQQEANSLHTSMAGLTSQTVAYEAVSPPPPPEVQSFSFIDSLHLYQPEAKDLLASTYELAENQVYLKNLVGDMPLLYAAQPCSDGSLHMASGLTHSLTVPVVASSGNGNLGSDKSKQPVGDACAMRQTAGDRESATDHRCKQRQKAKANTEVGVVLPMPQNKLSKQQMSSNPLLTQYDLSTASVETQLQQQQCAYEATLQYGSSSMPSGGQISLQNYKVDVSQKLTSPEASGLTKHTAFGSSMVNRNEVPSDTHNSPIVLTNITGNVYVNQYTMLQPGSMPLVNQDMSVQTMARYEQMMKAEQEKAEQKSCSVLLVPNENDDEFGHLSVDPVAKQNVGRAGNATQFPPSGSSLSTLQVPMTDQNVLPKQKAGNSAFENSYMNFVQGHKSETLSSVTNSPIKNRPVLPKYIPEMRRPQTDSGKTGSEGDESSNSRKQPLASTSGGSSCEATPKNSGTEATVTDTNSSLQADSSAPALTLSSTSTTKFPAKFSHKLQSRVHLSEDIAKTNSTTVQGKDKCEVTKEFKWKSE